MKKLLPALLLSAQLLPAIWQSTQAAELTADKMEFTRGAQVATGNAELRDKDLLLKASKISYKDNIAHAEGKISLKRKDLLVTGESLDYSLEDGSFTGKQLQVGKWPVYLESDEVTGDGDKYEAHGAIFYYGEPELYSPSIRATRVGYVVSDERYEVDAPWIHLGKHKLLRLPGGSYSMRKFPYSMIADAGNRRLTGVFVVLAPSLLGNENIRFTPGFGVYQERGFMLKPKIDYDFDGEGKPSGSFEYSWIRDQSDDPPIYQPTLPKDRYFVDWTHRIQKGDSKDTKVKLNWLSDADYLRDFDPDFFRDDFADSFAEASYHKNNYLLSAMARIQPDDVQSFPRRLPDVRADLLTSKLGASPIDHRGHVAMAWLEEDTTSLESTRFDAYYGLSHKMNTPEWFTLTPIAGARVTHYESNDQHPKSYTRSIGEVGINSEIFSHATWDVNSDVWKIKGLRHILKAIAQYRYIPESEKGAGEYSVIEKSLLQYNMPLLGLGMLPYLDQLGDQHVVRLGLENRVDTKHADYGTRRLIQLNVYQDIFPERASRHLEALYLNFMISPAHWLDLGLTGKMPSDLGELNQLSTGFVLRDGDKADLYFANEFITDGVQQNSIYLTYQANRDNALAVGLRHDADSNVLTEQIYTWSRSLGRNWIMDNTLVFRDGDLRELDFSYRIGMRLRDF